MIDEAKPEGGSDAYTRDRLQELARLIDEELPHKWGFFLMAFPFEDQPGRMNFVSNAKREDTIKLMKEFIAKSENKANLFQHHKDPLDVSPNDTTQPGYSDTDLMPFGKHINQRLQDVPAAYLHYLWSKRPISDRRLEAYIKENLQALNQEYPDGIW